MALDTAMVMVTDMDLTNIAGINLVVAEDPVTVTAAVEDVKNTPFLNEGGTYLIIA